MQSAADQVHRAVLGRPETRVLPCSAAGDYAVTDRGALRVQATLGDVQGKQPWAVQLEARAKWDAWAKLKGMSKEEAMQHYINLLEDPEVWENHELLKTKYNPDTFTI